MIRANRTIHQESGPVRQAQRRKTPPPGWRWAVIGSNSTALRQHAYSVFTASRRERESGGRAPDSVRRLLIPDSPSSEHAGPKHLVEAKSALGVPGVPPAPG